MTITSSALIQQAKDALKAGDRQEASRLLQQTLRMDAGNHVAWVMMAVVSDSPQSSLACVRRAEALNGQDPLVIKARAWVNNRLKQAASPPSATTTTLQPNVNIPTAPVRPSPAQPRQPAAPQSYQQPAPSPQSAAGPAQREQQRWRTLAVRGSIALLLGIILVGGIMLVWSLVDGARSADTKGESVASAGLDELPVAATEVAQSTATPTSLPPTETATSTPIRVLAKHVAQGDDSQERSPRATWTPTPRPTSTPSPTPTYVATYVSPDQTRPEVRPLGVGINDKWIDVDLSEQTLTAYEGNTVVYNTLVSSGLSEFPTVTGQFRIWLRFKAQTMDGRRLGYDYYLENVPYVMYFFEDYALHGTFWHNNFGTPMSHGCVNLKTSDAEWIYNWSSLGTTVNVHN